MTTPPTRRERRRKGNRYRRTTAIMAVCAALLVGAGTAGIWWTQRDETAMNVDVDAYVPPSEIMPSTQSPSPSTSESTTKKKTPEKKDKPTSSTKSSPKGNVVQGNPAGNPTRVQVTSGGRSIVDATLQATKLDSENVLAPPFGTAGWYAEPGWPKPGFQGASILVGHINHGSNPDVFWNLPQVDIGDVVTVTYSSGEQTEFTITKSEPATKDGVPQDDSIWDYDNPDPVLRLITCDPQTSFSNGHYDGNWVVWAD
ncbi:sortase domain-containing protein [Janibacter cremeus]|uniref:Sortase (Surface protein transpeptidase) n=1 Tax=Janibacter cremeus TaxID=1285192 RepID=A0A852VYK1_9MICO|nr:sortase (surface protein transpeptidase) [Janibacter cremeus]